MTLQAPFPYFGGKRRAAARIWEALGDVGGYIEPFAGSAAVLLARPRLQARRMETLNDADGWLVNAWRAIQLDPVGTARWASGPVIEADYHARLAWLQDRRTPELVAWLEGDPEHHDAKAAGWWLYVMACGIGDPFGGGPWHVQDGHLRRDGADTGAGVNRELPAISGSRGVFKYTGEKGISRSLPALSGSYGVLSEQARGPGIHRALPALGTNRGVLRDHGGLDAYLVQLADRLAEVRIACGDWQRVLQPSVLGCTTGPKTLGILLDPPYATSGDLYATTNGDADAAASISAEVRRWCVEQDGRGYRIALCGFEDEHDELLEHGWSKDAGRGGSSGYNVDTKANRRERLWLSPACLDSALFDFEADWAAEGA